jgi:uncharacterized protein (TIGR02300 family)
MIRIHFLLRGRPLARPELGEKRLCPSCAAKYYDLNRDPILCPKCGVTFELVETTAKAKPEKEPEEKKPAPAEEEEVETGGPEIISLEDAEDDDEETVDGDEEDVPSDIPDVEIEDEDDSKQADGPFLDDDDDDEDSLADIIPVTKDNKEDT